MENVEQAGNVVVFISGDGTHSKLDRAVSIAVDKYAIFPSNIEL